MSSETAMHFMGFGNMGTTSEDCKVTFEDHVFTVTKAMKKQLPTATSKSTVARHQADVKAVHEDWKAINDRYVKWYHKAFVDDTTYTPTAAWALLDPKST